MLFVAGTPGAPETARFDKLLRVSLEVRLAIDSTVYDTIRIK
jgi:hypothetical protein